MTKLFWSRKRNKYKTLNFVCINFKLTGQLCAERQTFQIANYELLGPGTYTFIFSLANPPRPTKPLGPRVMLVVMGPLCGQILYGKVKSNNHGDIMG